MFHVRMYHHITITSSLVFKQPPCIVQKPLHKLKGYTKNIEILASFGHPLCNSRKDMLYARHLP